MSGFATNRPDEGGEAADQCGKGDQHGGINHQHRATPMTLVPYLFPMCNRKIPITCTFLLSCRLSAKARGVRRAVIPSGQPVSFGERVR